MVPLYKVKVDQLDPSPFEAPSENAPPRPVDVPVQTYRLQREVPDVMDPVPCVRPLSVLDRHLCPRKRCHPALLSER